MKTFRIAGGWIALLLTLVAACGVGFPRPARAELTLSVAKDKTYGIYIAGRELITGTTETNPIRLDYGTTQARLNQTGANIRLLLSFGSDANGDTHSAGTFQGAAIGQNTETPLNIVIGGTSGEAIGTPVTVTLQSTFIGDRNDALGMGQLIDGTRYGDSDKISDITFTKYKVGDTFSYTAYIAVGANVSLQSTLSVAPVRVGGELPVTAPEPSSLLLLFGASVFAGGVFLPRRKAAALLAVFAGGAAACQAQTTPAVREISLRWPGAKTAMPGMPGAGDMAPMGSTHEIVWDRGKSNDPAAVWVSGQNYDSIARITAEGMVTYFPLPKGSGPHGMAFDRDGRLWVTFEFSGKVARLDENGKVAEEIDVRLHARGASAPINTHPHGLAVAPDGVTLWFTGKKTGTVGRIAPGGAVTHIDLPTVGSVPIYITPGPDGNLWCTELVGNKIARITPQGEVKEFTIPTPNSRPIALVLAPDKQSLWFSEEAGSNVARIDRSGVVTEFPLPRPRRGSLLGGLCFDGSGRLWVECYDADTDPNTGELIRAVSVEGGGATGGAAPDYLACFETLPLPGSGASLAYHTVPSRRSVLHRVIPGPGGALWFTEMGEDRVGILAEGAR